MTVVDVVWCRGDDDGGVVLLDDGGELGGDAVGGVGEVGVQVEGERGVEEDRDEAGPPRRLFGLGPASGVLVLEAEAGDDADHGPAPVVQVEERGGAADGLVVGVGGHMDDGGTHQSAGYVRTEDQGAGAASGVSGWTDRTGGLSKYFGKVLRQSTLRRITLYRLL